MNSTCKNPLQKCTQKWKMKKMSPFGDRNNVSSLIVLENKIQMIQCG